MRRRPAQKCVTHRRSEESHALSATLTGLEVTRAILSKYPLARAWFVKELRKIRQQMKHF